MRTFARAEIPGVTSEQWERFSKLPSGDGVKLEVGQLVSATGMTVRSAQKLIIVVCGTSAADLYWNVFHGDHIHLRRRDGRSRKTDLGPCSDCEEPIEFEDDLRYEMQAELKEKVVFR